MSALSKTQFYPKRWPFKQPRTLWYRFKEIATIAVIGSVSKFWLRILSTTRTKNLTTFSDLAVKNVNKDRPLLTISNHDCCIDDPVLFGLLPFRLLSNANNIRWTPGADEVMFYNNKLATLFGWGRVVPTIRGWGVHQACMNLCLEKLNLGELVIPFNIGSVDS